MSQLKDQLQNEPKFRDTPVYPKSSIVIYSHYSAFGRNSFLKSLLKAFSSQPWPYIPKLKCSDLLYFEKWKKTNPFRLAYGLLLMGWRPLRLEEVGDWKPPSPQVADENRHHNFTMAVLTCSIFLQMVFSSIAFLSYCWVKRNLPSEPLILSTSKHFRWITDI